MKADKEPANDVNFEILFQDALPAEAIDLREYLRKYKEKDQTKEFNVEENNRLKKEIFDKITHPDNRIDRISMWAMADDSVKPKQLTLCLISFRFSHQRQFDHTPRFMFEFDYDCYVCLLDPLFAALFWIFLCFSQRVNSARQGKRASRHHA